VEPKDRREGQDNIVPLIERRQPRLSPMAQRVQANKAIDLRLGGERPMGSDRSLAA
jgi:hypothetical protein